MSDLATEVTLVLQEAGVGEDAVTKIVKPIVEELTLERVDLGLAWKVLLKKYHFKELWLMNLEGVARGHPADDGREMRTALHL